MQGRNAATTGKSSIMAFKRELLKNFLRSLRARATDARSFNAMSVQERKRDVKSSADVAMAAARGAGVRWPKAILAAAAVTSSSNNPSSCNKVSSSRCGRVVTRCFREKRRSPAVGTMASSVNVARRLVRRRTMALRKVIPGADAAMDEASLLREALDYVVHLRAQVDVLRRVSEAVQRSSILRDSAGPQSAHSRIRQAPNRVDNDEEHQENDVDCGNLLPGVLQVGEYTCLA